MALFKQQAYYIENENLFFIDREREFETKLDAMHDLESFACRTRNRIQNRSYKCVVLETNKNVETKLEEEIIRRLT